MNRAGESKGRRRLLRAASGETTRRPTGLMAWALVLAASAATAKDTPASSPPADVASEALFDRARRAGEMFVVQIETVGGVQPLDRAPAAPAPLNVKPEGGRDNPEDGRFRDRPGSSFLLADGPTTGIIYSADGYVLTSSFNFVREPSIVTVKLPDQRRLPARIVARDHVRKLVLLKVEADGLPTPRWTPREQIRPGQWAVALGRGLGGGVTSVSVGIVSAATRMAGNAIQTDARLSPANYGGPLLDAAGRVLGICVPMAQRPGELAGIELYDAGVGFAIPGWRVHEIAERLRRGESIYRGWLGVALDPHVQRGVRILAMADPSPLRQAGAAEGDFIVAVNDKPIKHFGQLVQALNMLPAAEPVRVRLLRGAAYIDVEVALARSKDLGPLPEVAEPFDPSQPSSPED